MQCRRPLRLALNLAAAALVPVVVLAKGPTATAAPVTYNFAFNSLDTSSLSILDLGNGTVTGRFTVDTSNPWVVTALTISETSGPGGGANIGTISSLTIPSTLVMPNFDGTELVGTFEISQTQIANFNYYVAGTFGPLATGTLVYYERPSDFGPTLIARDSGGISYVLIAVPEPASMTLLAAGLLAMLAARRCRSSAISIDPAL